MVMRCLSDIRDNNMECLKSREDEMSPFHFFDGVLVIGAFHGDTASPPSKNTKEQKCLDSIPSTCFPQVPEFCVFGTAGPL
jgi:hypothetical protein